MTYHISFIEHNPNLVIMTLQSLNTPPELITNVKLVGIKQEEYSVRSLSKPLQNSNKIISSICSLFLPTQDARSVNYGDSFQYCRVVVGALEPKLSFYPFI